MYVHIDIIVYKFYIYIYINSYGLPLLQNKKKNYKSCELT